MPTATLTSKGQTTIPKEIREHLHLHPGDQIDFIVQDDGTVVLAPAVTDARELKAILHRVGMKTLTVEEMSAAVRKRAAAKVK